MFRSGPLSIPPRRHRVVAAAVAVLGIAVSVGGATASTPPDGDETASDLVAAVAPVPAETDPDASVVVGFVLEPTNLDIIHQDGAALDQVLLDNVYETILEVGPDGEAVPGVASLERSDDGLTYTLTVRDGVTFHDGSPLTAADIAWSLTETKEAGNAADSLSSVDTIEATDDATVVLTLTEPDFDLAWNLSRRAGAVVQAEATDLENAANGTGPFVLAEWRQGDSITLERFDGYWGEPAGSAEVVFQYIEDANARVAALRDGDIDILARLETDLLGEFEDTDEWVVHSAPTTGEYTLGMNNEHEALSDPLVRQAITQAIDKEAVLELFSGYGTIVGAPVPPTDPWYEDLTDLYPYDPDEARAKLAEAGYGDGLDLTFVVPSVYPQAHADYVVAQLGDIGINVELQSVEFPTWLEQVYQNYDYDLTLVLHVEPRDIDNYARTDYYWRYDSAEVQGLLAEARNATDATAYNELLAAAARQIAVDAPTVILLVWDDVIIARPGVGGYPISGIGTRFDASTTVVEA